MADEPYESDGCLVLKGRILAYIGAPLIIWYGIVSVRNRELDFGRGVVIEDGFAIAYGIFYIVLAVAVLTYVVAQDYRRYSRKRNVKPDSTQDDARP